MLEFRAFMFLEEAEAQQIVWCDEPEADAFGIYVVEEGDELRWIADFAEYGDGLKFAEQFAEDQGLVLVDRIRPPVKHLP